MSASKERNDESSQPARRDKVNEPGSRPESEIGGVQLPQIDDGVPATTTSGSSKRKRRPKKQAGRQEVETAVATALESKVQRASTNDVTISVEVQALKSKVQEIEQQVQEILLRPQVPPKSARRRQRQQKGPSPAPQAEESKDADREQKTIASDTHAELRKLQKELENAQGELSSLRAKKSSASQGDEVDVDEDGVEDIPRLQGPGLEVQRPRPLGRAVTLSGSYRIPIPVDVSNADLDAISRGIKSAQNIARSFISDFEYTRAIEGPSQRQQNADSGSWSEWFGGYSMSIAKAVDSMRLTSNIRTTPKRPAIAGRAETAPPRRKPRKLEIRSQTRPSMSDAAKRRLSEKQVAGLLA